MSVLTHQHIMELINAGQMEIDPFREDLIGPASIDLRLGNAFRVFSHHGAQRVVPVTEESHVEEVTEAVSVPDDGSLLLLPGISCLGITLERIRLPSNVCGWLQGRSRFARLGLVIHATASFIQPGVNNKQVLEITNTGQIPLSLIPGVAVCQIILEDCLGEANYNGIYRQQSVP